VAENSFGKRKRGGEDAVEFDFGKPIVRMGKKNGNRLRQLAVVCWEEGLFAHTCMTCGGHGGGGERTDSIISQQQKENEEGGDDQGEIGACAAIQGGGGNKKEKKKQRNSVWKLKADAMLLHWPTNIPSD